MNATITDRISRATSRLLGILSTDPAEQQAREQAQAIARGEGVSLVELGQSLKAQLSYHFLYMTGLSGAVPMPAQAPAGAVQEALVLVEGADGPEVISLRAWLDRHFEDVGSCQALLATAVGDSVEIEGATITRLGAL